VHFHLTPVMRLQQVQTKRAGVAALEHVGERREVAERLRHLHAADVHHPVVHPVVRELVARAFGLRDLVLVMREHEIRPAAVDVEARAEDPQRHRRALDVPTRAPRTPRRLPFRLAGLGGFPEDEVTGVALALVDRDACTGAFHLIFERAVRELAVLGQRRDLEVHTLSLDDVGAARGHELGDELEHRLDELGCVRQLVGPQHVEAIHLLPVVVFVDLHELGLGDVPLVSPLDDLVFDVGDVARVEHVVPAESQQAANHVEHDRLASVTEVRLVVGRGAAHVHRDATFAARNELDLGALLSVVETEHRWRLATPSPRPARYLHRLSAGTTRKPPRPRCLPRGRSRRVLHRVWGGSRR